MIDDLKNNIKKSIRESLQPWITEYRLRHEDIALLLAEEGCHVLDELGWLPYAQRVARDKLDGAAYQLQNHKTA